MTQDEYITVLLAVFDMQKIRTISVNRLTEFGACHPQIILFLTVFGDKRVKITRANLKKALDAGLQPGWVARHRCFSYHFMNKLQHGRLLYEPWRLA